MIEHYNRSGEPIELMEYLALKADPSYRRIIPATRLANGCWVSTVWLGSHCRFGGGPPLIFESFLFHTGVLLGVDYDCERYATEQEAIAGHKTMVRKWRWRGWRLRFKQIFGVH